MFFLVLLLAATLCATRVSSFAAMLTRQHCDDKAFEVGEVMMGSDVVINEERKIILFDNAEQEWQHTYHHGRETKLKVALLPKVGQFVFEVRCESCYFENGKCNGQRRIAQSNATLVLPPTVRGRVEIRALWAKSYGPVQLAPIYLLEEDGKKQSESEL